MSKFRVDGIKLKSKKAQPIFPGNSMYLTFESASGTSVRVVVSFPQTAAAERKALLKLDNEEATVVVRKQIKIKQDIAEAQ